MVQIIEEGISMHIKDNDKICYARYRFIKSNSCQGNLNLFWWQVTAIWRVMSSGYYFTWLRIRVLTLPHMAFLWPVCGNMVSMVITDEETPLFEKKVF